MAGIDTVWVLSGGGANGAYQNGFLQRLMMAAEEGNIPEPDAVVGTSVGALNGSVICQHPKGKIREAREQLDSYWAQIRSNRDVYRPYLLGLVPSAFLMFVLKIKRGLNHTKPLRKLVRSELDLGKFDSSARHFACNAVAIGQESETRWFESGDPNLVEGVLASSAFPIFFEPVKIDGTWYTDGGVRDTTAIGKAIDLGAKDITVIGCSPDQMSFASKAPKGLDYLRRTVHILLDESDKGDFQAAQLVNELVKAGSPLAEAKGWRLVSLKEARPEKFLGDSLDFSRSKNTELRTLGYRDAEQWLRSL